MSTKCMRPAVGAVTYPSGQRMASCQAHIDGALAIAAAVGAEAQVAAVGAGSVCDQIIDQAAPVIAQADAEVAWVEVAAVQEPALAAQLYGVLLAPEVVAPGVIAPVPAGDAASPVSPSSSTSSQGNA